MQPERKVLNQSYLQNTLQSFERWEQERKEDRGLKAAGVKADAFSGEMVR